MIRSSLQHPAGSGTNSAWKNKYSFRLQRPSTRPTSVPTKPLPRTHGGTLSAQSSEAQQSDNNVPYRGQCQDQPVSSACYTRSQPECLHPDWTWVPACASRACLRGRAHQTAFRLLRNGRLLVGEKQGGGVTHKSSLEELWDPKACPAACTSCDRAGCLPRVRLLKRSVGIQCVFHGQQHPGCVRFAHQRRGG